VQYGLVDIAGDIGVPEPIELYEKFPFAQTVMGRLSQVEWSTTQGWQSLGDAEYNETLPNMQVYASHLYRRPLAQALKLSNVHEATIFDVATSLPPDTELDPFMMTSAFAWQIVNSRVRGAEIQKAAKTLCDVHKVDRVRNLKLRVTLGKQRVRAVYFPAYVKTYIYQGRQYRLLVNGQTGKIGGDHIHGPLLVGAAAAACASPLVMLLPWQVSFRLLHISFAMSYS
jgi:hypothetical protein